MEDWVKQWLDEQRRKGIKCLEVKYIQNKPYVYRSTSRYDKTTKKPKKVSDYLGRLTQDRGLVPKGTNSGNSVQTPKTVREYGNAQYMAEEIHELLPVLQEAFPGSWEEIIALVFCRTNGYVPLKRIGDEWEKLDNVLDIAPDCDPRTLSRVLKSVGDDRASQLKVFTYLACLDRQLVYDLSFVFSQSGSLTLSEWGYNADGVSLPQVNIALFCGVTTGLPVMIRALPGSVRDIASLAASLREVDPAGKILILDRGFVSEDAVSHFLDQDVSFILPLRRNSRYYETRIHLTGHFFYKKRLVHCGKREAGRVFLYLFEDEHLMLDERTTLYSQLDEGVITREDLQEREKRAGRILILSNVNEDPENVYTLYKSRNLVEQHFLAFKSGLELDRLYLQDARAVFGHVFIGFLTLYLYCRILNRIRRANLTSKYSPQDVLLLFSKVYRVHYENGNVITEVPKKVRDLEGKLGLDLFPK